MQIHGPVLFVSDLKSRSDSALLESAAIASHAKVPLVSCHVLPEIVGIRPLFPQLHVFDRTRAQEVRDWATRMLELQCDRALAAATPRPALRVESGSTHTAVLDLARELSAGLVVVSGNAELHSGVSPASLVERISRQASCPVLLLLPRGGQTVLAATDFSDPALPAVHAARAEAERRQSQLYVVHSVDLEVTLLAAPEAGFVIAPGTLLTAYVPRVLDARREEAKRLLESLSKQLGNGLVLLREGPPVETILGAAESIDAALVVVGTHGRGGLSRFVLGSVAEGVLRGARRSTLVVPLHPSADAGEPPHSH